ITRVSPVRKSVSTFPSTVIVMVFLSGSIALILPRRISSWATRNPATRRNNTEAVVNRNMGPSLLSHRDEIVVVDERLDQLRPSALAALRFFYVLQLEFQAHQSLDAHLQFVGRRRSAEEHF